MKILVACEESQAVTIELRKLGHEAYSNDILPCSGGHPEWHLQQDVTELLKEKWDMIIAFPPCTYLTVTGNRWFNVEKYGEKAIKRYKDKEEAIKFFMLFANADCERIAIENPVGTMSTEWRKPDQIVNPFQFGDPFEKKTCLWLKGLPLLEHTDIVTPPPRQQIKGGKSIPTWFSNAPKADRAKIRSKTFPGIAKQMAVQWTKNSKKTNMKITVNRISILKALIPCSTIVAKKSTLPIIDNVLIEGSGNKLLFRTTSLNTEVLSSVKTEDDVTGFKCLMPCELLLRSIKSIRAEDLTLRIKEKEAGGTTLHIKTKKGIMKIEGVPDEGFPKTKYQKIEKFATIANNKIFESIKSSLSFIQANDTRPALTCLSLKLVKDSLTMKAMSSTHGGKIEMKNVTNSFDVEFDIAIQKQLIASFFNIELEGPFNIHVNENIIIIKNKNTMFICDLFTDAKFPNVDPIYAQKEVGYFVINPKELIDSVNRVCNLSEVEEKGGRTITFTLKAGMEGVEIASESYLGSSNEVNDIVSDETKGESVTEDINIRINAIYLQSVLQCCDTDFLNIHIQKTGEAYRKPVFFSYDTKVEGEVTEEKEFVLMPML